MRKALTPTLSRSTGRGGSWHRNPAYLLALLVVVASLSFAQVAPSTSTDQPGRFKTIDILLDPHNTPLAAYQVEFIADAHRVTLVGIEGGEHAAFKRPPYYDPAALSRNRVVLAAFNTGNDLPTTITRVARLHLRIVGTEKPTLSAKLVTAASDQDQVIPADVTVSEGAIQ
jgi:hypothetical protein